MGGTMRLADELAHEIWASHDFRTDLDRLQSANLLVELNRASLTQTIHQIEPKQLARLLQTALIFADSEEVQFREVAQRISTAALHISDSHDDDLKDIFALIQARLRNFPAISFADRKPDAPKLAPLTLQYEFIDTRNHQTIRFGDDDEHILTPFQLDSWRTLSSHSSATLTGPTSAGKSYVLLLHIVEQLKQGTATTIVYIVPTRALINQVADDMLNEINRRAVRDVTVTTLPVDLGASTQEKVLYVLTQERLEVLLISFPEARLDLIVIDEAQMLSEGTRGVLLEAVIDRITRRSLAQQYIFSGPMISNPRFFGDVFKLKDFAACTTQSSPVTQNLIRLTYHEHPNSHVLVQLHGQNTVDTNVSVDIPIRLQADIDKLSYLSFLFGRSGSSIVYANGKAEAEKIAIKIAHEIPSESVSHVTADLSDLIGFVKRHVHKDYALVSSLEKGVGFHYGHMPSLLRKELEEHFKARRIDYLVCTSTLLYGLNLPARNLFLLKPTTGRGTPISGADFWNLAGRAGRLGKEMEGNVFLIDYDRWETKPAGEPRDVTVTSALKTALVNQAEQLISFLDDQSASSESSPELEITLGKLVLDHRVGELGQTIERYRDRANADVLGRIADRVEQISKAINIPSNVINRNIGVSIFRQRDLLTYMVNRLGEIAPENLIPAHPLIDFAAARQNYMRAFKRIHTYLLKYPGRDRRHSFFSGLALRWMRGDPLPVLINSSISYNKSVGSGKSIARIIRDTMENVEDDLRFRYVKFFTCYNSLLEVALNERGFETYVAGIPNVPLFLEVGGSSGAMINLMAFGLSRTSAEALSEYITNKDMNADEIRAWLREQNLDRLDLSPICLREIDLLRQKVAS